LAGGVNLYSYAGGNPVAFKDPFGLCVPWCTALAGGIAFGAIRVGANLLQGRPVGENVAADALRGTAIGFTMGVAAPLIGASSGVAVSSEPITIVQTGLAALTNADRAGLREFFGSGIRGAQERAANFRIPEGLTREALENYAIVAREAIAKGADKAGTQVARLELVQRALDAIKE
jgi:hypothetical protein